MVYNVHYCLNQIFVSSASSGKTCNLCGTDKKKDCCKSETKVLKTDVAQKADISIIGNATIVAIVPRVVYANFFVPVLERNQFSIDSNAPPDKSKVPLFISHCNFRI